MGCVGPASWFSPSRLFDSISYDGVNESQRLYFVYSIRQDYVVQVFVKAQDVESGRPEADRRHTRLGSYELIARSNRGKKHHRNIRRKKRTSPGYAPLTNHDSKVKNRVCLCPRNRLVAQACAHNKSVTLMSTIFESANTPSARKIFDELS